MGRIIIDKETTKNPISLMGRLSGVCYHSNTEDDKKNYARGLNLIKSGHGRTLEFPSVYFVIEGYSAKVVREFYTHIGGAPTRLQESTRYVGYDNFNCVVPPSVISKDKEDAYLACVDYIRDVYCELLDAGVPKEDASYLLPMGMETRVVCKFNPRTLVDMSRQRECTRALWEYRNELFRDLKEELSSYSEEWKTFIDLLFKPKCEELGYCPEKKSCGRVKKLDSDKSSN